MRFRLTIFQGFCCVTHQPMLIGSGTAAMPLLPVKQILSAMHERVATSSAIENLTRYMALTER